MRFSGSALQSLLLASLLLASLVLSGCPGPVDSDGDGHAVDVDCDDSDPERHPGRAELCNGADDDCDNTTWLDGEGVDFDEDGSLACADCDDEDPAIFPGAAAFCATVDADCDGDPDGGDVAAGASEQCPAVDCASILAAQPGAEDGLYWIDAGTGDLAFEVSCDMSTEGGGWIRLQLDDEDGVFVASRTPDNPWHKCDDDAATWYEGLTESEMEEDVIVDPATVVEVTLAFLNPETGELLEPRALQALRSRVSELHPENRMVATIGDDDGGTWQDGGNGGLEVYIVTATGDWILLTPGTGGDCGGASGWPSSGSQTAFYLWSSDPAASEVHGDSGLDAADWSLEGSAVLPVSVQLAVFTGGGVSFGWEQQVVKLR